MCNSKNNVILKEAYEWIVKYDILPYLVVYIKGSNNGNIYGL
jgi:stringent starvation protein B